MGIPNPNFNPNTNPNRDPNPTNLNCRPNYTRNSSEDEIANVNFFTTTSSTTFTQCAPEATEFREITQNKDHYAVQGHSRSPILVPIESSYTIC